MVFQSWTFHLFVSPESSCFLEQVWHEPVVFFEQVLRLVAQQLSAGSPAPEIGETDLQSYCLLNFEL